MKKAICMIAVAAISFSSVGAYAALPMQTQQDTTMKKKPMKKMKKKKMMKDSTMKKDTMKM